MVAVICLLALSSLATAKIVSNASLHLSTMSTNAAKILVGQPLDGFSVISVALIANGIVGNKSHPNKFSNNLLNNIGDLTGTKPHIRVGGNTQDYAIYNPKLKIALKGTINATRSPDYPTTIEIGRSFFESYLTWPDVKFIHGFNLGGNHDDRHWATLIQTAEIACKTLGKERLDWWEFGNEPDFFATSAQGPVRPSNWNESDYVAEWLDGTRAIKGVLSEYCPDMLDNDTYGYIAPSFGGVGNHLKGPRTWADGLDTDGTVRFFSTHNYISGATTPGVTLQGTLMNHTRTRSSVDAHVSEFAQISPSAPGLRQIMGETNSLYNQGTPGLSNSFGAALWGIDFNLYCASVGIARVNMHMGTNYRYASWQPINTDLAEIGTKAPYYGNVAVAAFLGNLQTRPALVAHFDLGNSASGNSTDSDVGVRDAAYGAYVDDTLARIMVINMRAYNHTLNGTGNLDTPNPAPRGVRTYSFGVDGFANGRQALVRRLYANGSDAVSGITWDGVSYNYELKLGKPVRLHNVTTGERVSVKNGVVEVDVPDSQAVVLDFGA
ncbi:hypothetical protein CHU98_g8864 [Xylaria longipes]|nr:hypothetical protein CHU98_g8864 [Xylaria longipes]